VLFFVNHVKLKREAVRHEMCRRESTISV